MATAAHTPPAKEVTDNEMQHRNQNITSWIFASILSTATWWALVAMTALMYMDTIGVAVWIISAVICAIVWPIIARVAYGDKEWLVPFALILASGTVLALANWIVFQVVTLAGGGQDIYERLTSLPLAPFSTSVIMLIPVIGYALTLRGAMGRANYIWMMVVGPIFTIVGIVFLAGYSAHVQM